MRRPLSAPSRLVDVKGQHQMTDEGRKRRRQPASSSHAFLGESEFELAYPKDIEFLPDGQHRWGLEVDPRIRDAVERALRAQKNAESRRSGPGYMTLSDNKPGSVPICSDTPDALPDVNGPELGPMDQSVPYYSSHAFSSKSLAALFSRLTPFVKMRTVVQRVAKLSDQEAYIHSLT